MVATENPVGQHATSQMGECDAVSRIATTEGDTTLVIDAREVPPITWHPERPSPAMGNADVLSSGEEIMK